MKFHSRVNWSKSGTKTGKIFPRKRRRRNKLCFTPWSDCRDDHVVYWQRGFNRLCKQKYKCTVKRRRGKHICDCHVVDCFDNCVVLRDCHGEKIIICFDDICSLEMNCGHCSDWDWDDIFRLFN